MEKIIFNGVVSTIKIQPNVELEISETDDKDYFLIEGDDLGLLNIDSSSEELRIAYKNQPSLGSVVDALTDFFVKRDLESLKNLETPSTKIKIKLFTKNDQLRVKINKGSILVSKNLSKLELKANHSHNLMLQFVKNLTLKVNHGNILLQLSSDIESWDIKLNSGNLNIHKNGNECSYTARIDGDHQQVGLNPKINIRINSGILKFDDA